MAFWIYHHCDGQHGCVRPLKLTGRTGLLANFLQARTADTPFAWVLASADIIRLADPSLDPERHEVLLDMLPESLTEICLYSVGTLRGVSEYDESDLVLACKLLFQGKATAPANVFKRQFQAEPIPSGRQMVEAFRLTGGLNEGTYFWAKPKMDIGGAICPATAVPAVPVA